MSMDRHMAASLDRYLTTDPREDADLGGFYNARIRRVPERYQWKVELYHTVHGYLDFMFTDTHAEAIALADAWVRQDEAAFEHLRMKGNDL